MKMEEISNGMSVMYISYQGASPEYGRVSSKNDTYVFVKFNEKVAKHGWDGTTSEACRPETLQRG